MKNLIIGFLLLANSFASSALAFDKDSTSTSMYDVKVKEGEFYMYHQNYERSIEIYNELLTKAPEDEFVNYRLGICYFYIDKENEAERCFEFARVDSWYRARIILFKEMQQANPKTLWW